MLKFMSISLGLIGVTIVAGVSLSTWHQMRDEEVPAYQRYSAPIVVRPDGAASAHDTQRPVTQRNLDTNSQTSAPRQDLNGAQPDQLAPAPSLASFDDSTAGGQADHRAQFTPQITQPAAPTSITPTPKAPLFPVSGDDASAAAQKRASVVQHSLRSAAPRISPRPKVRPQSLALLAPQTDPVATPSTVPVTNPTATRPASRAPVRSQPAYTPAPVVPSAAANRTKTTIPGVPAEMMPLSAIPPMGAATNQARPSPPPPRPISTFELGLYR